MLRHSFVQKQLLQVIITDSDEQYKAILKDIDTEILPSTVVPLCVIAHSSEQVSVLLRNTLAAFIRARDYMTEGNAVVVTVGATLKRKVSDLSFMNPAGFSSGLGSNDTFDDCGEDRTSFIAKEKSRFDQEYSKLAVSLACSFTDCLSAWEGLLKTAGDSTSHTYSPRASVSVSISEASLFDNRVNARDGPAARIKNLLAQKACQNACISSSTNQTTGDSPSSTVFDPHAKLSSRSVDALMETASGLPQGITAMAPSLERACCRRISNIFACYLGEHSFDPS
jgi:hypothetical protein